MKTITHTFLVRHQACSMQESLFYTLFGTQAKVTHDNVLKATEAGLSFIWLYGKLHKTRRLSKADAHRAIRDEEWVNDLYFRRLERADALLAKQKLTMAQYLDRMTAALRANSNALARIRYKVLSKAKERPGK